MKMSTKIILGFTLSMILSISHAFSEEIMVQTLSQGACWFEHSELLKLTSFNDKESLVISREEIDVQLNELLNNKKNSNFSPSELMLHCGGYGASLIVKTTVNDLAACVWLKIEKGNLKIRSVGGLENSKGDLCDGYKWGELIVGIKFNDQKNLLQSEGFRPLIKSVTSVGGTTLKLVLNQEFMGKELEAMSELKKHIDLKYVELNFYQHPIGEVASIK
jgi:hypothetical protein